MAIYTSRNCQHKKKFKVTENGYKYTTCISKRDDTYISCDLIEKKEYVNLLVHAEEMNIMIGDCKCACTEYVKYQHQNSKI